MDCFNHRDTPAICACAHCFKGLCENCMQPSDKQFCCSESCGQRCQQLTRMNDAALKIYRLDKPSKSGRPIRLGLSTAILNLCIGITLLGYSIYEIVAFPSIWKEPLWAFALIIGCWLTISGIKTYKNGLEL